MDARAVTLYDRHGLHVAAKVDPSGTLVLSGQDLGGSAEYEYWVTVDAVHVTVLLRALGADPGMDVLELLLTHRVDIVTAGEVEWLERHGVPSSVWTHGVPPLRLRTIELDDFRELPAPRPTRSVDRVADLPPTPGPTWTVLPDAPACFILRWNDDTLYGDTIALFASLPSNGSRRILRFANSRWVASDVAQLEEAMDAPSWPHVVTLVPADELALWDKKASEVSLPT